MSDKEAAESALRGLAGTLGVTLPVGEIVELGAFVVSKFRGATWSVAIQAGVDARNAIIDEASAEASRRARMEEKP